jgi:hypothetical protein
MIFCNYMAAFPRLECLAHSPMGQARVFDVYVNVPSEDMKLNFDEFSNKYIRPKVSELCGLLEGNFKSPVRFTMLELPAGGEGIAKHIEVYDGLSVRMLCTFGVALNECQFRFSVGISDY